ncbi:hypothetical protein E3N88_11920 [Mikania micrantha]|uniref:F-box domain-containing protein n=1 Tax=Mikania micrantha TaxID=192012 RepID=A0A5N6P5U2_9ASTR|nr:hypothetical protein E3N88_11920 [Mikania micrantha]
MTESSHSSSISELPEGCISEILSLTSPRDACRAASISNAFKSAADSDAVWERFLPPDYRDVIATAVSPVVFESKKQLYHRLSDSHIILDREPRGYLVNRSPDCCFRERSDYIDGPFLEGPGGAFSMGAWTWQLSHLRDSFSVVLYMLGQ